MLTFMWPFLPSQLGHGQMAHVATPYEYDNAPEFASIML